ncbi:hypothetical protein M8542_40820 [Amycolatopsis sp. OK19-0408]|uniref:DUF4034 domain-containing protein n=1 Tax=Amycolatopsis iheyensis TaxID=2945988 RepID=A0A9X2NKH2_9PSEU|nr:hypothetical protein [Amycolatopsis iheyensis]MCR6489186.1 hypothetical protein [Amycolatopsis iheyensis]
MSSTGTAPAPVFDPAAAFPEAGVLRSAAEAGDWPTVSGFFARFTSPDERSFGVTTTMSVPAAEPMLRAVVEREPRAEPARVLLAAQYVQRGWTIRGTGPAAGVSRDQFAGMHEWLRQAEHLLIDVTAREPANAVAWWLRLITARGLGLGQSEARRRYDRLAAHHPGFLAAQRNLLQQLSPKWGGSWDAAHAFVRECTAAARPGDPQGVLVPELYLERWLELGPEAGGDFLRGPGIREEIAAAAATSVLHPAYRSRFGWVVAHSTFAMAFSLIGDLPRAAVHFRVLGGRASEGPWHYFPDPVAAHARHRDRALAKG